MGNTQTADVHDEFEEISLVRPTREQVDATFEQLVVSQRERERESEKDFRTPARMNNSTTSFAVHVAILKGASVRWSAETVLPLL